MRWLGWVCVLVAGCFDRGVSVVEPPQCYQSYPSSCDPYPWPELLVSDIDIVFVIDDSPGSLPLQTSLKASFPAFVSVLTGFEGRLPNVHIGVVSSDLGTKGAADATAGPSIGVGPGSCSGHGKSGNLQTNAAMISGAFLSDVATTSGSHTTNYSGTIADAFSALASAGDAGCGFEQPLEAAKRALVGNTANAGFLRPDAPLALIFVQNEDDCSFAHSALLGSDTSVLGPLQSFRCNRFGHVCSTGGQSSDAMNQVGSKSGCSSNESSPYLTKVGDYVSTFLALKESPYDVIVAAIAGPTTPYAVELRLPPGGTDPIPAVAHSCSGAGVADPAVRLAQFVDSFPNHTPPASACEQDLSTAMIDAARLIGNVLKTRCLPGTLADVDPHTPGPQNQCEVFDVTNYGQVNQTDVALPRCNESPLPSNQPCWEIGYSEERCPTDDHMFLHLSRTAPLPLNTVTFISCVREA